MTFPSSPSIARSEMSESSAVLNVPDPMSPDGMQLLQRLLDELLHLRSEMNEKLEAQSKTLENISDELEEMKPAQASPLTLVGKSVRSVAPGRPSRPGVQGLEQILQQHLMDPGEGRQVSKARRVVGIVPEPVVVEVGQEPARLLHEGRKVSKARRVVAMPEPVVVEVGQKPSCSLGSVPAQPVLRRRGADPLDPPPQEEVRTIGHPATAAAVHSAQALAASLVISEAIAEPERQAPAPVEQQASLPAETRPDQGRGCRTRNVAWQDDDPAPQQAPPRPARVANRTASAESLPALNVDDVRRRVEGQLLVQGKSNLSIHVEGVQSSLDALITCASSVVDKASYCLLRLGGVLPWSSTHFWPSVAYQWLAFLLHVGLLIGFAVSVRHGKSRGALIYGDLVMASGTVLGLVAVGVPRGSGHLHRIIQKLQEVMEEQGFCSVLEPSNALDFLVTFTVWAAFMGDRIGSVFAASSQSLGQLSQEEVLRIVAVGVSSAELCLLVTVVLRIIRGMAGLVDSFCTRFWSELDYTEAVGEWNKCQASVRMASSAVERCFAVLQSTMVMLALAMVFDFTQLAGTEWALTSSGLLILGLSQVLLRAASVTDACTRLPQLVNATALAGEAVDHDRTYLVEYITASAAGFYVFNVRLAAGLGIRIVHYTGLFAITIARLVLPSGV